MSFWSSDTLRDQVPKCKIVEPYDVNAIKHGAYELRLGADVYRTSNEPGAKQTLNPNESFAIPPGQFALLVTFETVTIPDTALGLISIKSGIKSRGLINVSGFHVDPGFTGQLHFAVYNAGSQNIVLTHGDPVFLLWLCGFDVARLPAKDLYNGTHNNQKGLTSNEVMQIQGDVASPAALKKELDNLRTDIEKKFHATEHSITVLRTIAISVACGLLLLLLNAIAKPAIDSLFTSKSASPAPSTSASPATMPVTPTTRP